MLACQRDYVSAMAEGKTKAMTEAAKRDDSASHAHLNKLRSRPENATCFDCNALKPGWAVLPHGIFVCIECAQLHRSLGRHISQTKAINTGTYLWYPHEIRVMEEVGNAVAARAFGMRDQPKPSRDASPAEKLAYVKAKYESANPPPDFVRAVAMPENVQQAKVQLQNAVAPLQTQTLNRFSSITLKPGLKGALRTSATALEQPATSVTSKPNTTHSNPTHPSEPDLIRFDQPAILPPKPCPIPSTADRDFFAAFGL